MQGSSPVKERGFIAKKSPSPRGEGDIGCEIIS